jgi:flagellar basal-body rod protein FlgG
MLRTWFTGASGMRAQQFNLDAVANNLANVDSTAYKRDAALHKAFPELLIRRMDDDGLGLNPFGSNDAAPIIGRLGTGVELNELFTDFQQGALKESGSSFDVALDGKGFLAVATPQGERYTRNGAFVLGKEGILETSEGFPVLGEKNEPIRVKENNFRIDKDGGVWINAAISDDPNVLISQAANNWEDPQLLDYLKIVDFDTADGFNGDRHLQKQGSSLWKTNEIAGEPHIMEENRPRILQGFTEASNVEPVAEMVRMIEIQRAYEANQKVIQNADSLLGVLINQVGRIQA